MEYNRDQPGDAFGSVSEIVGAPESVRAFSEQLVLGVLQHKEEIDHLIGRASTNWRLDRMSHVDRNILRVGIFEILHMKDIPPKVSIDEAVELGKKFGTKESGAFINGILDHVLNACKAESTDSALL